MFCIYDLDCLKIDLMWLHYSFMFLKYTIDLNACLIDFLYHILLCLSYTNNKHINSIYEYIDKCFNYLIVVTM